MHIFISYAKVDSYDLAVQLRDQLRQLDAVTVWMDETLEPGESWALQIQEEIDAADYVIVLLSPDVNRPVQPHQRRSFVLNEIDYAQQSNKTIIPVMAQKTRVPVQIAGVQFIDFTADPNKGYTRLLRKIAPHVTQPPAAITLPPSTASASKPFASFKNPLAQISRRWLAIGLAAILAVVLAVFVVLPALNDRTSFEDAPDALGTMAALAPTNQALQTATSVARTQAADSQLAANQTSIAATGVIKTQEKQLELATSEANGVATGVVATQENQDQLATNEASIAETGVVKTQIAVGNPTNTPVPVIPVVSSNTDWSPNYQTFNGVEMALVPSGCFMMGQNGDKQDLSPAYEQCFDQPFWIDRYEVTDRQYGSASRLNGDNHPHTEVSWFESRDFCTARGARLPTEREWEYAARGPSNFLYPWGNSFVADAVVFFDNSNDEPAAVGSRPAGNSWVGASDMSGNVWEWVSSRFQPFPYTLSAEDVVDPSDDSVPYTLRGGSWNSHDGDVRAVDRFGYPRHFQIENIGFRCARDYSPSDIELPTSLRANTDWHPIYRMIDGFEMAYVPAGCFTMGQNGGEEDQAPAGEQCFERDFWIDRYEITNAQFGSAGQFTGGNQPRDSVSWFQARDFCKAREGSRLPTEAEWEYAARGPSNFVYPWGKDFVADNVVYIYNANDQTAPVGSRPAGNSWVGASDMSGNLLEWVSSRYMRYPYDVSDGREVNSDDTEMSRVLRGGSYKDNSNQSALRFDDYPMNAYVNFGFRCVRLS